MNINQVKELLEAKLTEILLRREANIEGVQVKHAPDPIDQASNLTALNLACTMGDQDQKLAESLRDALRRIEAGTYGECAGCDEPIAPRRLSALPWAILCVDCASHQEKLDTKYEKKIQKPVRLREY